MSDDVRSLNHENISVVSLSNDTLHTLHQERNGFGDLDLYLLYQQICISQVVGPTKNACKDITKKLSVSLRMFNRILVYLYSIGIEF